MHHLAAGGPNAAAITIIWLAVIAAYWLPTIIAFARKVPNRGSVAVVDFFLGWTIVGWVIALAMAVRSIPALPAVAQPGEKP